MENHWNYLKLPESSLIGQIEKETHIPEKLAIVLAQRGYTDFDSIKKYFRPSKNDLHDPFLLKDMEKAVKRISKAIEGQEKIMLYGDYDVDGTTSVSLLYTYLEMLDTDLIYHIPDRYKEGYGISKFGLDRAKQENCSLVISLDCGITAVEKVDYANSLGLEVIVTDHHNPGEKLPNAFAILNPKQKDCKYPYKMLSGCGVAYKLISALNSHYNLGQDTLDEVLDLTAISIAADIVPITGENRTLAFLGMEKLKKEPRTGLKLFLEQDAWERMNITDVVFKIAPRINAAGRIEHAHDAVRLLLEKDLNEAQLWGEKINGYNEYRKSIQKNTFEKALAQIENHQSASLVVFDKSWHKGVIGIVASKLVETFYKPTLVFTQSSEQEYTASARSVVGFNLYEALKECSDLLTKFGGHKYAAGLSLKKENFERFKERFEKVVVKNIKEEEKTPHININSTIELHEITPRFVRILKQMEPFGPENMNPVFVAEQVRIDTNTTFKAIGKKNEHLKMNVSQKNESRSITCIGFGLGHLLEDLGLIEKPFSICFSIEENHFMGQTSIQLNLKDIRI